MVPGTKFWILCDAIIYLSKFSTCFLNDALEEAEEGKTTKRVTSHTTSRTTKDLSLLSLYNSSNPVVCFSLSNQEEDFIVSLLLHIIEIYFQAS